MAIAVLILGMHRSGTSATAGVLQLAGVDLGKNLTPPREENPRGFFEHDDIWQLHQRLLWDLGSWSDDVRALPARWFESGAARRISDALFSILAREFAASPLWGVKDPRLSRLFPLWPPMLQRLGADPRLVLTLRHPLESAQSLARRDGLELSRALGLWLRYTLDAERATREHCRVVLHFADLLSDWRGALQQLDQALGIPLANLSDDRERRIITFLDGELRHQHAADDWLGSGWPMPIGEWCDQVYRAMLRLPDLDAVATIDRVAARLAEQEARAIPFSAQMSDQIGDIGHLRSAVRWLEIERGRLSGSIDALEAERITLASHARKQEVRAEHAAVAQRRLEADLGRSLAEIEALDIQLRELRLRQVNAQADLKAIQESRSWRITRPIRGASQWIRTLRAGVRRLP